MTASAVIFIAVWLVFEDWLPNSGLSHLFLMAACANVSDHSQPNLTSEHGGMVQLVAIHVKADQKSFYDNSLPQALQITCASVA